MQHPKQVEVCEDVSVGGDRTGDALMGAIIGGIIGNNVTKDLPDGGTCWCNHWWNVRTPKL